MSRKPWYEDPQSVWDLAKWMEGTGSGAECIGEMVIDPITFGAAWEQYQSDQMPPIPREAFFALVRRACRMDSNLEIMDKKIEMLVLANNELAKDASKRFQAIERKLGIGDG